MFLSDEERLLEIELRLKEIDGDYDSEWEEIYCLRQEQADLLRPREEAAYPEIEWTHRIPISQFNVGDYIEWFGVVGRVEQVKLYRQESCVFMPIYCLKCSYVGGDFSLYSNSIRGGINKGTAKGYLFAVRGNDLFLWSRCVLK